MVIYRGNLIDHTAMEKITTQDGSETFRHMGLGECYHSMSGAVEEALEKFVRPCGLDSLARKEEVVILDVCFGLGYNSAAAIDTIKRINPDCRVMIYALENDRGILNKTKEVSPKFESYELIRAAAASHKVRRDNVSIDILAGDARRRVRELDILADAVFFDPFSPRKQPSMWTGEFFGDIYRKMKKGAVLATYSCARVVRDNLKAAGFGVKDGPVVGRKSPSTLGIK